MLNTLMVTLFLSLAAPAQTITKHNVYEIAIDQIPKIQDPYFAQTWADFTAAGGEGRIFNLELDLDGPDALTMSVVHGPIIYITKKPSQLFADGHSVYNTSEELLVLLERYDQSPLFLMPYGRGVHGAVFERQYDFLVKLYELALPNQHTPYAFVITPSLDASTFIHELEHVAQKQEGSAHSKFLTDLKALTLDGRWLRVTERFGAELSAYIAQWEDLDKKERTGNVLPTAVVQNYLDRYKISKVPFADYLSYKRDTIWLSVELHAGPLNTLSENLQAENRAAELCPLRAVVEKHLQNDLFSLALILPEWTKISCRE